PVQCASKRIVPANLKAMAGQHFCALRRNGLGFDDVERRICDDTFGAQKDVQLGAFDIDFHHDWLSIPNYVVECFHAHGPGCRVARTSESVQRVEANSELRLTTARSQGTVMHLHPFFESIDLNVSLQPAKRGRIRLKRISGRLANSGG